MELVDEEIAELEETELDETDKAAILKQYVDARQLLAQANTEATSAAEFRVEAQDAGETRDQTRSALENRDATKNASLPLPKDLTELEIRKLEPNSISKR